MPLGRFACEAQSSGRPFHVWMSELLCVCLWPAYINAWLHQSSLPSSVSLHIFSHSLYFKLFYRYARGYAGVRVCVRVCGERVRVRE